ncbi:DUF1631 domain-containing protein [Pseudomonas sp. DP16D-R1]|uniref:DUF1631 domain-containing protein n=1 Tax=Pseudomonas sp. DP16D-R1 TaxID=2075551 RepID=UPI000CD2CC7C|nr:DUF1631 domain-containing protein [Pseudomonas sp. DP16D-R1]POA78212.1 DUF1631 domain-containing protein [Pseudomonas sp. DP16D-R1]
MHKDGNVVPLRKATTDQAIHLPLARLPVILLQVRDKATQQLRQSLQELFDNADDTLFELADRARSDVEHNIFFQAMRDLRLKRKSIERVFFEQFFDGFIRLAQYETTPTILTRVSPVDVSVALENDELERNVAVESMVNKVLHRDGYALDQLTARLSTLLGGALIERHNPMGPTMLCEFFLQAARHLGVTFKVKLIILKLFDRYVLSGADQLYAEANQLLIATGVLPGLKPAPGRRMADQPPSSTSHDCAEGQNEDAVPPVFPALQQLLLGVRGSVVPTLDASTAGEPISSQDLLRLLSHLQESTPAPNARNDLDLRTRLQQLLTGAQARSGRLRVVGAADADVINLIAMLFQSILDDRHLPDALKALMGRLQIPMVKVAVLDKRLFSRSNHPARRLLNEIASAAQGWSECDDLERDSLYVRTEQVVQRLLNDFVDDPAIFSEVLADFLAFTSDERRRSELLEQRTRDVEEGRARTLLARQRVEQALNQALLGKVLPQSVVLFARDAWSKVLLLTCLKHGDQSTKWHADVQVMEDLIWSVQRHEEPDAGTRLLARVPGLLKSLREGLSGSAYDPFATSEFFSELESLHVQLFERPECPLADAAVMIEVLERIVLPSADEGPVDKGLPLPADDAGMRHVNQLHSGCWVEFQTGPENSLRCKLAAIIEATGQYIFVNRTGMKVLERSRSSLAREFRQGAARVLDDTLLFDRALESVIGHLRRLNRGK